MCLHCFFCGLPYIDLMPTELTYAEKMLRAVRKAIKECIEGGAASATISQAGGSKSYTRYSLSDLHEQEAYYAHQVNQQRGKNRRSQPDFGGR